MIPYEVFFCHNFKIKKYFYCFSLPNNSLGYDSKILSNVVYFTGLCPYSRSIHFKKNLFHSENLV